MSLRGLEAHLDELDAQLAAARARGAQIPHRARCLELSHRLPQRLLDAHRAWVAEVIAELDPDEDVSGSDTLSS